MGRDVTLIKTEIGKSSSAWMKVKPFPIVVKNFLLMRIALLLPLPYNNIFFRLMGVKIGKNVQIMPKQFIDIFFPELITIDDGAVVGMESALVCHEFNPTEFRYGKIHIGKEVLIGARSFILPGVTIGDKSLVSAQTVVYKDVPKNVLAFGSPLQFKEIEVKEEIKEEIKSEEIKEEINLEKKEETTNENKIEINKEIIVDGVKSNVSETEVKDESQNVGQSFGEIQ